MNLPIISPEYHHGIPTISIDFLLHCPLPHRSMARIIAMAGFMHPAKWATPGFRFQSSLVADFHWDEIMPPKELLMSGWF